MTADVCAVRVYAYGAIADKNVILVKFCDYLHIRRGGVVRKLICAYSNKHS